MPKKIFPVEKWKSEHHYWIPCIWISQGTKFQLKLTVLIFWTKFTRKEFLMKLGEKWTTYEFCIFQISRYQTSASRIKYAPKWYFQSKTEKVNSTTQFCIFKLVLVANFSLIRQFWFCGANLPKKGISSLNQKKWTPPLNSAYSNQSPYQIFQFKLTISIFLSRKLKNWRTTLNSAYLNYSWYQISA